MSFLRERAAQQTKKILEDQTTSEEVKLAERQSRDDAYLTAEKQILETPEHQELVRLAKAEINEVLLFLYDTFSNKRAFAITINSAGRSGGIRVVNKGGTPIFDEPFGIVDVQMKLGDERDTIYHAHLRYKKQAEGTDFLKLTIGFGYTCDVSNVLGETERGGDGGWFDSVSEVQDWAVKKVAEHDAFTLRRSDKVRK